MELGEIKFKIANGLRELETHNNSEVKSRKVYNERLAALNNLLDICEQGLQEYPIQSLMDMKYRIKHSIQIMEFANEMGVITEP